MSTVASVDFSRLKVLLILEGPGAAVLTHTLRCGTHNTPPCDLHQYLKALPPDSTARYTDLSGADRRKQFDASQKRQIKNNPLWEEFDISLLYKAITLACEGVAPRGATTWQDPNELEGLLTKIKNERNDVVHERPSMTEGQFQAKVTELESLFVSTLRAVQVRYSVSDPETRHVQDQVMSDIQSMKSIFDFDSMWREWRGKIAAMFIDASRRRLESLYRRVESFDPLSFLGDPGEPRPRVPVQTIFTKLLVKTSNQELDCRDALTLLQPPPSQHISSSTQPGQHPPSSQHSNPHTQPGQQPLQFQHFLTHTLPGQQPPSSSRPPRPPQLLVVSGEAGSGKSTYLGYIMSEYVLNKPNCSVKHLDSYDLVLRVFCRERDASSLKEYLELFLPESKMMAKDVIALLRCCKVLFLVDGLDEANHLSTQLVIDIVKLCKVEPNFFAIFTSRPETARAFLTTVPQDCGKLEARMQGVHPSDRTVFVLKHYECLDPAGAGNDVKVSRLRGLMTDIGWREHFGLPLNLLFLSTIFIDNAERITNTHTQTSLCVTMHEWCIAKMRQRLVMKGVTDRRTRERGVEKVLSTIYRVAFQNLLEGRLSYLSAQDEDAISECCQNEGLPYTELMGAFFSMRKSVENRVLRETYCTPHKGVLEFYAARHIVEQLHAERDRTSITGLLWNSSPIRSSRTETLRAQRNLLLHVAGLLSLNQPDRPSLPRAMEEVVDLLEESGVCNCGEWMSLIAETEVNEAILRRVAHHVQKSRLCKGERVTVTDNSVCSAAALLPLLPRKKIEIELTRDSGDVIKLFGALARHSCEFLRLQHHFRSPGQTAASGALLRRLPDRTQLEVFDGHLDAEHVCLLPRDLKKLYLAVTTQEELSALQDVAQHCFDLRELHVHVPMSAVTNLSHTPLPDMQFVYLHLSKVKKEEIDLAAATAALCHRSRGYWAILLPEASLKVDGYRELFEKMAARGVRVCGGVYVPGSTITDEEKQMLTPLAEKLLGCHGIFRWSEEDLWRGSLRSSEEDLRKSSLSVPYQGLA